MRLKEILELARYKQSLEQTTRNASINWGDSWILLVLPGTASGWLWTLQMPSLQNLTPLP